MYNYQTQRPVLFTESGSVLFTKVRDKARKLLQQSGAVRAQDLLAIGGDPWDILACIDRMVELKDLREVTEPGKVAGQYRVFINVYLLDSH